MYLLFRTNTIIVNITHQRYQLLVPLTKAFNDNFKFLAHREFFFIWLSVKKRLVTTALEYYNLIHKSTIK